MIVQRYETENSIYLFDTLFGRYARFPKTEGDEQSVRKERLKYGQWHRLKYMDEPFWEENGRLRIMEESSTIGIVTSPITKRPEDK